MAKNNKPKSTETEPDPLKIKTNLSLWAEANAALTRIKAQHGMNRDVAASRGILMLENNLNAPQGRSL